MIIRSEAKAETLEQIYDICNRLFKDKDCFYTSEELEQARANQKNIFIARRKEQNEKRGNSISDMVYSDVASTAYQGLDFRNTLQARMEAR